jgi:hypothetical protein
MVRVKELIEAVLNVLKQSGQLPSETNFIGVEPDMDTQPIKLPLVEVSSQRQEEVQETNTSFVGFRTDDDGNQIGKVFQSLYYETLEISVYTAQGSKFDPKELGQAVRDVMFGFSTKGPNKTLIHPDFGPVNEVYMVEMLYGNHTDDLGTSPPLRRWTQELEIYASEQYLTDADSPPALDATVTTE